jgi:hypothetical protein
LPTSLQNPATPAADGAPGIRYAYKASLVGAAHQFELTDIGLSWHIAGRSGMWPYADISAIRLSYRPVSMQSRRFRADIGNSDGARLAILSTSWQSAALMAPQDQDYRLFITALHARLAQAGSHAILAGGLTSRVYGAAIILLTLVAIAMAGLLVRAIAVGEWTGVLFLLGFAALFAWQVGGFIRRNRPRVYTFDHLPKALLP